MLKFYNWVWRIIITLQSFKSEVYGKIKSLQDSTASNHCGEGVGDFSQLTIYDYSGIKLQYFLCWRYYFPVVEKAVVDEQFFHADKPQVLRNVRTLPAYVETLWNPNRKPIVVRS